MKSKHIEIFLIAPIYFNLLTWTVFDDLEKAEFINSIILVTLAIITLFLKIYEYKKKIRDHK